MKVNKKQFVEGIIDKVFNKIIAAVNAEKNKKGQDIINLLDDNLKVSEGKLKRARTQKSKDIHQATIDQINDAKNYGQSIINAINSSPENVSDDQIDLLIKKQELVNQKQGKDKAFSVNIDNQIKEIDKQIAKAVVDDDEAINSINNEIDSSSSTIGQFNTNIPETEEEE